MEANEKKSEAEASKLRLTLKLVARLRQELAAFRQDKAETMVAFKRVGNALKTANTEVFHYKHLLQQTQHKLDTFYDEHVTNSTYAQLDERFRLLEDEYNHQVNVSEIRYQTTHREWQDKCTKLEEENDRLERSLQRMLADGKVASLEALKPQKPKRVGGCNKTVIGPVCTEEYAELELALNMERDRSQHLEKELVKITTERDRWESKAHSCKWSEAEKEIRRLKSEHEKKLKAVETRIEETVAGRLLELKLSSDDAMIETKNISKTIDNTEPSEQDDLPQKYVQLFKENTRLQKLLETQQSTATKHKTNAASLPQLAFCEAPLDIEPNPTDNEESDSLSTDVFEMLKTETLFTCLRLVSPLPDSEPEQVGASIITTSPPKAADVSNSKLDQTRRPNEAVEEAPHLNMSSLNRRMKRLEQQILVLCKANRRRTIKEASKARNTITRTKRRTILKKRHRFLTDQLPWLRLHQMQLRMQLFRNRRCPPRSRDILNAWCTEANLSYPSDDSDNETISTVRKKRLKKRKAERKIGGAPPIPESPASPAPSEQTQGSVDSGFPRSVSESETKTTKRSASEDSEVESKKSKCEDSLPRPILGPDVKEIKEPAVQSQSEKLDYSMSEIFGSDSEVESPKLIPVAESTVELKQGNKVIPTIDPPDDIDRNDFNRSYPVAAFEFFHQHLELRQRCKNDARINLDRDLCLSDDSTCSDKKESPTATDQSLGLLIEDGRKKMTVIPASVNSIAKPVAAVNGDKRITILSNVVVQKAPHVEKPQSPNPNSVASIEPIPEGGCIRKRIAHKPLPNKVTIEKNPTPVTSDSDALSPRRFSKRIREHELRKLSPIGRTKVDESIKENLKQTNIIELNPCVTPPSTLNELSPVYQSPTHRKVVRPRKLQGGPLNKKLKLTGFNTYVVPDRPGSPILPHALGGSKNENHTDLASPPRDSLQNLNRSDLISKALPEFDQTGDSISSACTWTAYESPLSPQPGPADSKPTPSPVIIPLTRKVQRPMLHTPTKKDEALMELLMACPGHLETEQRVAVVLAQREPKVIASLVLHRLARNIKNKPERYRRRRAPQLTKTEQVLLGLLLRLNELGVSRVISEFLEQAETQIVQMESPVRFAPVARLHAAVCKYLYLYTRMRLMLCSALTYMGDRAIPYVYIVLNTWLDLVVAKEVAEEKCSVHERLLIRTIMQVINMKRCAEIGYNLLNLRRLVLLRYGYSNEPENSTELLTELFKSHAVSGDLCTATAVTMLVKNMKTKQVMTEINTSLKPLVKLPDVNLRFVIALVRKITTLYDQKKQTNKVQVKIDKNKEWLKKFSEND